MKEIQVIEKWVELFNKGDVETIGGLYAEKASLHVVFAEPTVGQENIQALFQMYFSAAELHCIVKNMVQSEDGWVTLEWQDRVGLPGCNVFQIKNGLIVVQRNYFDQLTFHRLNGIPIPTE